jgi:hypothetical protein
LNRYGKSDSYWYSRSTPTTRKSCLLFGGVRVWYSDTWSGGKRSSQAPTVVTLSRRPESGLRAAFVFASDPKMDERH